VPLFLAFIFVPTLLNSLLVVAIVFALWPGSGLTSRIGLANKRKKLSDSFDLKNCQLPRSNDEPFASAAYGRYRVAMLKMGADLYEIDSRQLRNDSMIGAALHASIGRSHPKLIVTGRQTTFVGSMNMDLRSSRVNTELGMLVHSSELAENVLSLADRLRLAQPGDRLQWVGTENGVEKIRDTEPDVDLGTRLQLLLLFSFISESLL
jgi:putative cardiolipin synthase